MVICRFWRTLPVLFLFSPFLLLAQTDLVTNGSFESGLTGWSWSASNESGSSGTCSYNAATAPGVETLTSTVGFPASDGTEIVLGSVSSTSGTNFRANCTLYQDIAIPVGTGTLTLKFDGGGKNGNDGCSNTGLFVGLFSTATVPNLGTSPLAGGNLSMCTSTPASTLLTYTVNKNASSIAGTTVRLALINAANFSGHEVVGVDHVQLLAIPAPPTVTGVSPSSGTIDGGTSVTITGTNFTGATAVTFGGTAATGVTVNSATSISAVTPAHALGSVSVVVTTPAGSNSANSAFTYTLPPPTVTGVSPAGGTTEGGTSVTITGTDFTGATAVTFDGTAATSFSVVDANTITAVTPAHVAGEVSVVVTTPTGSNAANTLYAYALPTPTLSEWGLILMTGLLLGYGWLKLRRGDGGMAGAA